MIAPSPWLTFPPSVNRAFTPVRRGRHLAITPTKSYRAWKVGAQLVLKAWWRTVMARQASGPLSVTLEFAMPSIASDIDNRIKPALDAANGVIWSDDKQICELRVMKRMAKTLGLPKGGGVRFSVSSVPSMLQSWDAALSERLDDAK